MKAKELVTLDRGVFTISLDFELIWGTLDLYGPERFRQACQVEREIVIDRLLGLFVEFNIPATWCTVGHLFLEHCATKDGNKHPEITRPMHSWFQQDWFTHDPSGSEKSAPEFLGRSLVEKIRACPVPQEIGCHSFSHVIFGDAGCSRATAENEIAECVRLARAMGLELRAFAFPRNLVGHLDVLQAYGFTCYRGPELHWYEQRAWPGPIKRLAHLWDVIRAAQPPLVMPEYTKAGIWNIPGSMIYFPMHGLRRFIPLSQRVKRAIKGLNAAAQQKQIFHLWFHPTNLAEHAEKMFVGLRAILKHACALRTDDKLTILPMGLVASAQAASLLGAQASLPAGIGDIPFSSQGATAGTQSRQDACTPREETFVGK